MTEKKVREEQFLGATECSRGASSRKSFDPKELNAATQKLLELAVSTSRKFNGIPKGS